jgi:hypothetical protein
MAMSRRKKFLLMSPLFVTGFLLLIALGGEIVRQLWNWLLPPLFGVGEVTFWQALGLLALCRILVGGFGLGGSKHDSQERRQRMADRAADRVADRVAERWDRMSQDERERFRQRMRDLCGFDPGSNEGRPAV